MPALTRGTCQALSKRGPDENRKGRGLGRRGDGSARGPHAPARGPAPHRLLAGPCGPEARPQRGDARPAGTGPLGALASHRPRPGCSELSGPEPAVPTTPARSPSHLHLPGLAAAITPTTSPAGATQGEAEGVRASPAAAGLPLGPDEPVDFEISQLDSITPKVQGTHGCAHREASRRAVLPPGSPRPMMQSLGVPEASWEL